MRPELKSAQSCLFVHPDNAAAVRAELRARIAIVARPDEFLENHEHIQLLVETKSGVHPRIYLAEYQGLQFVIVYGRFGRVRTTSRDIDYELTQHALDVLGINVIVGMFAAGSVATKDKAGTIFLPDNLIGFGGFNSTLNRERGFRNVDLFVPFCSQARSQLTAIAGAHFPSVVCSGVYACFHGYPRIETEAELTHYQDIGCRMVGQTMDPEATLARESGCHYVPIVGTIDDAALRARYLANDKSVRTEIERHTIQTRRDMLQLFLKAAPELEKLNPESCSCAYQSRESKRATSLFYYRPRMYVSAKTEQPASGGYENTVI